MSRGGQAVPVASVIDSYRKATTNLPEALKHADELIVYDNAAHRRGVRVVAQFIGGNLCEPHSRCPTGRMRSLARNCMRQSNTKRLAADVKSISQPLRTLPRIIPKHFRRRLPEIRAAGIQTTSFAADKTSFATASMSESVVR